MVVAKVLARVLRLHLGSVGYLVKQGMGLFMQGFLSAGVLLGMPPEQ